MSHIEQATGAQIIYHPETFTPRRNIAMVVVGLGAITALAIGIIALLHNQGMMNAGSLNMPKYGIYILLGGGGGLLLVNVILLASKVIQQRAALKNLTQYASQADAFWHLAEFRLLEGKQEQFRAFSSQKWSPQVHGVLQIDDNVRSIHLFADMNKSIVHSRKLHNSVRI